MTRIRGNNGKFIQKSQERRSVKSIRVTDSIWETLGNIADERGITRADLIEHFVSTHVLHEDLDKENEKLKDEIVVLRPQLSDLESVHRLDGDEVIDSETKSLKNEIESLESQIVSQSNVKQLELIEFDGISYSLDDLIKKGKQIILDESMVRAKDRSLVRKYFGLLLDVDRDMFK